MELVWILIRTNKLRKVCVTIRGICTLTGYLVILRIVFNFTLDNAIILCKRDLIFMDKHDVWVCFPCEQIALLFFLVEDLSYCSMWALPNDTA